MKYVVVRDMGFQVPILLDDLLVHAHVASGYPVVSAGFCEVDAAGRVTVSGESDSLHRSHRPEDAIIIQNFFAGREPFPASRVLSIHHPPNP